MIGLLWVAVGPVQAQAFRFPAGDADYVNYYVTAYYDHGGVTDWSCESDTYSGHRGSDFGVGSWSGMDAGQDIVAAADGVVETTNDGEFDECTTSDCAGGGGFGNYVKLQHDDGRVTYYAHMKKWTVAVSPGDRVSCGDLLGQVGSSGYSSGPHLHFEPRTSSGTAYDPFTGACNAGTSSWVVQGPWGDLPAPVCDTPPGECVPQAVLTCGDSVGARNDSEHASTEHWYYGCSEFTYSGSEVAWEVLTDRDEPVTVTLSGLTADLDLFLLSSAACDGTGCVAHSTESETSDESATAQATAEVPLVVVVDGWEGAVSGFHLSVACEGGLPEDTEPVDSDPGDSKTDTGEASTDTSGTGDDTGPEGSPVVPWSRVERPRGGCATGGGALPVGWWLLASLVLFWRRPRS